MVHIGLLGPTKVKLSSKVPVQLLCSFLHSNDELAQLGNLTKSHILHNYCDAFYNYLRNEPFKSMLSFASYICPNLAAELGWIFCQIIAIQRFFPDVKWYKEQDQQPFLQWIPSLSR